MGPAPEVAATRSAVRHALVGLPAGGLVVVACSGGADSLALAAATASVAARRGLSVGAVVVDHGLQPGSGDVAARTASTLRALGLDPVETALVAVGSAGGPEAAARSARYAALDEAADRLGASAVLLGHTLDDQAETVLLGLARGSGARSLAGMPARSGRYRRPFLRLPRTTTVGACRELGLAPWSDPHNGDPRYARVRVRASVLPALESALGPGVAAALARTAQQLRADADALEGWARAELRNCAVPSAAGAAGAVPHAGLGCACLARLPEAVRTRVLRMLAVEAGSPAGSLTAGHVLAMDRLVVAWHGQGPVALPGPRSAARRCGRLVVEQGGEQAAR